MTATSPRPAGEGDQRSFDEAGLPGFQFIQDPHGADAIRHTNIDTYERLNIDDLARNAAIVASFVYHAATRADLLPRKK
jgi:Zn-dependent M28 family amino/carboxypeptidase